MPSMFRHGGLPMAEALKVYLRCFLSVRSWLPELALLVIALGLGVAARQGEPLPLDVPLGDVIQSWHFPFLDALLRAISAIGWFRVAGPTTTAVVVILAIFGWRQQAVVLTAAAISGHLLNQMLKALIERPRPELAAEQLAALGVDSYAFPSGHVQSFTIFYGFLAYFIWQHARRPWLRWLGVGGMLTMIVLVGISRVYLGVHWPSDVVGAYSIGILWLHVWIRAQRAWCAAKQQLAGTVKSEP